MLSRTTINLIEGKNSILMAYFESKHDKLKRNYLGHYGEGGTFEIMNQTRVREIQFLNPILSMLTQVARFTLCVSTV